MTPGEAASMNPGGAVIGGDAGVRELVAACVAEVLETLLSMNPGGAVKIGGDADVRELVVATVAEALETLLVAAVEEEAQRKKAQREKAQRERLEWLQRDRLEWLRDAQWATDSPAAWHSLALVWMRERATDSAALVSPPTVPSVVPPSMTGIGVGSGTLGTMTTLDGVI